MKILRRIFGSSEAAATPRSPFRVGDRVSDPWGNKHTVISIEPRGENGLGTFQTRSDTGTVAKHAMIAHGFTLLAPQDAGVSPPKSFAVARVKPEESSVGAYLREEKILLCGMCITNYGGLDSGPCQSVHESASDAEIGTALLAVLAAARTGPVPADLKEDRKEGMKNLLRLAGVRSMKHFNEGTVHCSVWQTPSEIRITPSANEGRCFSYLDKNTSVCCPTTSTPDEIAKALREGFAKCS